MSAILINSNMKTLFNMLLYALMVFSTTTTAGDLTFGFKNPSFSGTGWSSHVLSIEQLQFQREQGVIDDKTAAEKAADRAAKNTTLSKFVTNVESRIFANLSKQMVDNMFGTNCTPSDPDVADIDECPIDGTATLPDGSTVKWEKDTTLDTITLTVTDATGTITQLIVPVGDFKF
jgi:hypothetical protein